MDFYNTNQLTSYIGKKTETALLLAQEQVFLQINKYIKQYYAEYTPEVYERTYQLYKSLVKSNLVTKGNQMAVEVYLDANQLDYHIKNMTKIYDENGYVNPFNYANSPNGQFQSSGWSEDKTLASAAHGSHGGVVKGTAIWDESMKLLKGSNYAFVILYNAIRQLGIPIKY